MGVVILWAWLLGCAPTRPDVLVFTLDTTRADALGLYGRAPSPSPTLDALAPGARVYDEALSPAPLTLPAHAALFTGRYPARFGLRRNGVEALPAEATTLAERLGGAGYRTGAFVGAVVLDGAFGLDQGFETYADGFDLAGPEADQGLIARWPAATVADRAQSWLLHATSGEAPVFLWMHLYDAHLPHDAAQPRAGTTGDAYHDAVAYMDEQIGHVLALHATLGRGEPVVVVAGDHGEGRGDHGEQTHGYYAYRSTLRVPLLVRGPGVPAGRVTHPVSLVDVSPTILALVGLDPEADADGRDLLATTRDGPVYGEAWTTRDTFGLAPLRVIQNDTYRYIAAPRPELYAWRTDPGETTNLVADAEHLAPALVAAVAQGPYCDDSPPPGPAAAAGSPAATTAALASLGYLAGPAPVADLADPKDFPGLDAEVEQLVDSARRQPPVEGAALLERFLAERREVPHVRLSLARAWLAAGQPLRAAEAIGPLRAAHPDDPSLAAFDAQLHLLAGDASAAERLAREAVTAAPRLVPGWAMLAEALRQQGRVDEATQAADTGLALSPDTASILLARAVLDVDAGRVAEALPRLERAVAVDPANRDGLLLLAVTRAQAGRADEAIPLLLRREERYGRDRDGDQALARSYYVVGDLDAALPRLLRQAEAEPMEPEWQRILADALLRAGRREEGQEHLRRLAALAADDADLPGLTAAYDAR